MRYKEEILKNAAETGVSPSLVSALIFAESGYRANVTSRAQAKGLMQLTDDTFNWLMSKTKEDLAPEDIFTPEINIRYGTLNLAMLLKSFPDRDTALAAYNAGRARVSGWLKNQDYSTDGVTLTKIPYPETVSYIKKIDIAEKIYRLMYFWGI